MKLGRRYDPSPNTRSATGTPRSPMSNSRARAAAWFGWPSRQPCSALPFHGHQISSVAPPSSVPSPVIAMSWQSIAYTSGE